MPVDAHRLVTMLEKERGAGPLVGCQLRYRAAAWLAGAVGFAASAHRLRRRGRRDDAGRRAHRVVGLCRFSARMLRDNRASHALRGAVRRVRDDFEARYGYRPSGNL